MSSNSPESTREHYRNNYVHDFWMQDSSRLTEQKKFGDPGSTSIRQQTVGIRGCRNPRGQEVKQITKQQSASIRKMWASNNKQRESVDAGNPRMAGNQHRQQNLGIRGMQESTDVKNPTQTTDLGIRGMQESNNRQRDSADAGTRG